MLVLKPLSVEMGLYGQEAWRVSPTQRIVIRSFVLQLQLVGTLSIQSI